VLADESDKFTFSANQCALSTVSSLKTNAALSADEIKNQDQQIWQLNLKRWGIAHPIKRQLLPH